MIVWVHRLVLVCLQRVLVVSQILVCMWCGPKAVSRIVGIGIGRLAGSWVVLHCIFIDTFDAVLDGISKKLMVILAEKRVPKLFHSLVKSLGEFCQSLGLFCREETGLDQQKDAGKQG